MENIDLKTVYMNNLNLLKESLNKSVSQMAMEMNVSANTLKSYLKGDRTTSLELATHLYLTYNINLHWFCTGKGEMFNALQKSELTREEIVDMVEKMLIEKLKDK